MDIDIRKACSNNEDTEWELVFQACHLPLFLEAVLFSGELLNIPCRRALKMASKQLELELLKLAPNASLPSIILATLTLKRILDTCNAG